MKILRLGDELELQLPVYATAIATLDPSCVCDYTTVHGNAGCLDNRERPGMESESSQVLGRFVSAEL